MEELRDPCRPHGHGADQTLAELGPRFVVPYKPERLDTAAVFGRQAPLVLEIGFGMGGATAEIAALPDHDFIGCEVHEPGVALLKLIGERDLANIRIVQHDAEVLQHYGRPSGPGRRASSSRPWHKKRHHKRRLSSLGFVANLVQHLQAGGYLHCATDWQPYAEQMLEVLSLEPLLENTASGYADKPPTGRSPSLRRGLRLGHGGLGPVFRRRA